MYPRDTSELPAHETPISPTITGTRDSPSMYLLFQGVGLSTDRASVHCRIRFQCKPCRRLNTACLTSCSHNSPFGGLSNAEFDTCYSVHRGLIAGR
ncbi:hypothetical protein HZ326_31332 [Fusarium oxysporum f. sp. albedinis]|nr:hypothetical protein HZ326_31332 [Fusarium oxysporum f. sp. albedinis]